MRSNIRPRLIAGLLALLAAAPAARAQYTFTPIADSSSPTFSGFGGIISINSSGTTCFLAGLDGGGTGIFTGAGGPTATVALTTEPTYSGFAIGSINDLGVVAFQAMRDTGGTTGIYTGTAAGTNAIVESTSPTFHTFPAFPRINGEGAVAFLASRDAFIGGGNGIFRGTETIALSADPVFSDFGGRAPAIDAAGTVVFYATLDDASGAGIFTGSGGPTTAIALASGPMFSNFEDNPSINAGGTVGFAATLDAGGSGIFTSKGGVVTTWALSSGPTFGGFFTGAAINTAGTVAFAATLDFGAGGGMGIYIGDGGAGTRVIRTGDALFGSTVTGLTFATSGLNDSGQLVFRYSLADGIEGIAVASPPGMTSAVRAVGFATAIPSGTGNFTSFIPPNPIAPAISSTAVAFFGSGSGGQEGIYFASDVLAQGPPIKVADTATAIPGGTGNFTSFIPPNPIAPAIHGASVAFYGAGSGGQQGMYLASSPAIKVADTATAIPGGTGNFTGFGDVSLSAAGVAFLGFGAGGQQGIYAMSGGALVKVVDLGDALNGQAITSLEFSGTGRSGDPVAFQATLADGSQGIYTAGIAPFVLLITSVERIGNDFVVNCTSEFGRDYALQSRADLATGTWATLPGSTTSGTGETLQWTVTNPFDEPQQFYRVIQVP